ncbi:hypothetical protein [Massilia antarctica]|uniref:hypothetical protein n=1 Tax=Massilia antarctica TaxID=2765360 RepID=UPI00227186C4|nr:hypothetical protein [Massilia sp. H27-R4]MCY0910366.1 hypothetical protein [Massilia sp. H27-R4]
MASRGIIVSYETIRQWTLKFGQGYADELRGRQPQPARPQAISPRILQPASPVQQVDSTLASQKSLTSMQHQEEGSFDEWADDEYFSGVDLTDWQSLTA